MGERRQYTPSNGSEGLDFQNLFCDRCIREARFRATEDGANSCPILMSALAHEHPPEWTIGDGGSWDPSCSAFDLDHAVGPYTTPEPPTVDEVARAMAAEVREKRASSWRWRIWNRLVERFPDACPGSLGMSWTISGDTDGLIDELLSTESAKSCIAEGAVPGGSCWCGKYSTPPNDSQTPGTADYMAEAERLGQMRLEVAP